MDAGVVLSHFQDTVVDSQANYGADKEQFTGLAPTGRFNLPGGGSGWADAGVIVLAPVLTDEAARTWRTNCSTRTGCRPGCSR